MPPASTLNLLYWLVDSPVAFGAAMLTMVVFWLGATYTLAAGALVSTAEGTGGSAACTPVAPDSIKPTAPTTNVEDAAEPAERAISEATIQRPVL